MRIGNRAKCGRLCALNALNSHCMCNVFLIKPLHFLRQDLKAGINIMYKMNCFDSK